MAKKPKQKTVRKPQCTVEDLLQRTPNRPDPKRARRKIVGRYTQRTISEFFFELFHANEKAAVPDKKTNAALAIIVCQEFPKRTLLCANVKKGEKNGINWFRQKYNTGRLCPGRVVQYISFRYNEVGERVDFATGKKRLTVAEQKKYLDRYQPKLAQSYRAFAESKAEGNQNAKASKVLPGN